MGKVTTVAKASDVPLGKSICVEVEGKRIALFNVGGKFYAIDDECTHAGGNLSEGDLDGTVVTCPWHGATFDIADGKALSAPAFEGVTSYRVQVSGGDIQIEAP